MATESPPPDDGKKESRKPDKVIYRVTRKCPTTGRVLDARNYGLKAWRIVVTD